MSANPEQEKGAGERSISEVISSLSRKLPDELLKTKPRKTKSGGTVNLTFLEWHTAVKILDKYAPGWCYEIRSVTPVGNSVVVVARITIPCSDGFVYREATGIEDEDLDGYGDPASNAEAMALKRAASKFGLGLYLYRKDK